LKKFASFCLFGYNPRMDLSVKAAGVSLAVHDIHPSKPVKQAKVLPAGLNTPSPLHAGSNLKIR
jgi:hypothetical protein